jgi:hypothetical protein
MACLDLSTGTYLLDRTAARATKLRTSIGHTERSERSNLN